MHVKLSSKGINEEYSNSVKQQQKCKVKSVKVTRCLTSTDTHAHIDRYERSHRPIRTLTSVDVRQLH